VRAASAAAEKGDFGTLLALSWLLRQQEKLNIYL